MEGWEKGAVNRERESERENNNNVRKKRFIELPHLPHAQIKDGFILLDNFTCFMVHASAS